MFLGVRCFCFEIPCGVEMAGAVCYNEEKRGVDMIRVLFQGDSITDGNRYKEPERRWDLNHRIEHTYVYDMALAQNPSLKLIIMEPFMLPVGRYKEHYADFMRVFSRKQEIP